MVLSIGSPSTFAETTKIQNQEHILLKKYEKSNYYDVNIDFMNQTLQLIQSSGLASFKYDFPVLTDELNLSIKYPPDGRFKVYTFDVGGGGTMGEYQSYPQFKAQPKSSLTEFSTGFVQKIDQIRVNQQAIYLVQSYYKGSNCVGSYALQAVKVNDNQLIDVHIFYGKNKATHEIVVDFDCHDEIEHSYIQLSKDQKILNVQFLDAAFKPQAKWIRYVLKPHGYVYQGVFKQS